MFPKNKRNEATEIELDFEAKQNLVGFFSLLDEVSKRIDAQSKKYD
jgi:hypothetical protein